MNTKQIAQDIKLAVNTKTEFMVGWDSVTDEVIEMVRAKDEQRVQDATKELMERLNLK